MLGIKPENGRWPIVFLNQQKTNLLRELTNCQQWQKDAIKNLREPMEKHAVEGNEADFATVKLDHFIGAVTLEKSVQKICDIQTALANISDDLKSKQRHNYGGCVECGQYISASRLKASPWVQKCTACQESCEMWIPIPSERKAVRPGLKQIRLADL